jgi:hypothetical protein
MQEIFLLSIVLRLVLGTTKPSLHWDSGALSCELNGQGNEADQTPPSNVDVRNGGAIHPLHICIHGIMLNYIIKYRDNFTFSYLYSLIENHIS